MNINSLIKEKQKVNELLKQVISIYQRYLSKKMETVDFHFSLREVEYEVDRIQEKFYDANFTLKEVIADEGAKIKAIRKYLDMRSKYLKDKINDEYRESSVCCCRTNFGSLESILRKASKTMVNVEYFEDNTLKQGIFYMSNLLKLKMKGLNIVENDDGYKISASFDEIAKALD